MQINNVVERLQILNRVGMSIAAERDLLRLYDQITNALEQMFAIETCAILLLDRANSGLKVLHAKGYPQNVAGSFYTAIGSGITGYVAQKRKSVYVPNVLKDKRYIRGALHAKAEIAAPLIVNHTVIGVLDAEFSSCDPFDEVEVELFGVFANHVAAALQHCFTFEALGEREDELTARVLELRTLAQVGELVSGSLEVNEVLQKVINLAGDVLPFESCAVLLTSDSGVLTPAASRGYRTDVWEANIHIGQGITGMVAQLQQPVLIPDVTKDERYIPGVDGGRCEIAAPLIAKGRLIGVIDAESTKPDAFSKQDLVLLKTFANQAAIAIENARLHQQVKERAIDAIGSLARALEARDSYTKGHSERVTQYAICVAKAMNVSRDTVHLIEQAGLLHDIGKIGVSDAILNFPGNLEDEQLKEIRKHPVFGDDILGVMKFLGQVPQLVLNHHERFDGTGYPQGLKGEEIPLAARIISVADAFDAMTSNRPYREAKSLSDALDELRQGADAQFDRRVVDVFCELVKQGKLGIIR